MSHLPLVIMGSIPGGVQCDTSVTLEGKFNSGSERFDIELKSGFGDSDIPLHSSFRSDDGCVVMNHLKTGCDWGSEERGGAIPLCPGQDFIIQFKIHSNTIDMSVNGSHYSSFNHRLPMSSISCVAVFGGASISSIKFC